MRKLFSVFSDQAFFWVNFTQFFDTFNNNFFRTALTSFVMFEMTGLTRETKSFVSAAAVGLLMLPAFLFSALAGELADKYAKNRFIQVLRWAQLAFVPAACLGFYWQNLPLLLTALLAMGTGGSMLSPAKYGILPEILPKENLLAANALMQAAVYLSILGGTILGGIIFSFSHAALYAVLCAAALAATAGSLHIPAQKPAAPEIAADWNFLRGAVRGAGFAWQTPSIRLCVLAISWFWLGGTVLLAQIPTFVTYVLKGNDAVFTFFIVLFSAGVGAGSLLCQILLGGRISGKYCVASLVLSSVFLADLTYLSLTPSAAPAAARLGVFFSSFAGLRISFDLLAFAACGGVYVVPLTALLQVLARPKDRARVIAANNIVNALFMVAGSGLCAGALWLKQDSSAVFGVLAALNLPAAALLHVFLKRNLLCPRP